MYLYMLYYTLWKMKKENIFTKIVEKEKNIFIKPISTSVFGNTLRVVNIINGSRK